MMASIVRWAVWGLGDHRFVASGSFKCWRSWRHRKEAHWLADLPDSLPGGELAGVDGHLRGARRGGLRSSRPRGRFSLRITRRSKSSPSMIARAMTTGAILDRLAAEDSPTAS